MVVVIMLPPVGVISAAVVVLTFKTSNSPEVSQLWPAGHGAVKSVEVVSGVASDVGKTREEKFLIPTTVQP